MRNFCKDYWKEIVAFVFLAVGLLCDNGVVKIDMWTPMARYAWYLIGILPVGLPVFREMLEEWREGEIFNEFFLMVAAAVAAFVIGECPEGLAVLLF